MGAAPSSDGRPAGVGGVALSLWRPVAREGDTFARRGLCRQTYDHRMRECLRTIQLLLDYATRAGSAVGEWLPVSGSSAAIELCDAPAAVVAAVLLWRACVPYVGAACADAYYGDPHGDTTYLTLMGMPHDFVARARAFDDRDCAVVACMCAPATMATLCAGLPLFDAELLKSLRGAMVALVHCLGSPSQWHSVCEGLDAHLSSLLCEHRAQCNGPLARPTIGVLLFVYHSVCVVRRIHEGADPQACESQLRAALREWKSYVPRCWDALLLSGVFADVGVAKVGLFAAPPEVDTYSDPVCSALCSYTQGTPLFLDDGISDDDDLLDRR